MKIALMVYQFIREKGGVESYVYNLSKQLLDQNHEIHIFAHRFSNDQELSRYALSKNKKLIFHYVPAITFWSPLKHWTFAVNAPKVIKKTGLKFDLVHGFTQTLSQDIYRVGGGCHWDYMMHTYPLMQSLFGRIIMCLNPRHVSLLLLERFIFKRKRYKQIICVSEQCKKEIVRHYKLPTNDIEVIYNGVDVSFHSPENKLKYRDSVRTKYEIAPDEVLLLFLGSGFKRKGLKHVIDALPFIERHEKTKLLIVGKGNIHKYLNFAKEKGFDKQLIFVGVSKQARELLAAGDIFVFPSEYDPFGSACLEAMATGIPVIVSKASGVSEFITEGKDGFIINHPINPREIARYINVLMDKNKRDLMGSAARKKSELYSLQVNTEKMLHLYRRILDVNTYKIKANGC